MRNYLLLSIFLITSTVLADSSADFACSGCKAEKIYDSDGNYVGCYTNVNGHTNFNDPSGLTELGCDTFCVALNSPDPLKGVIWR